MNPLNLTISILCLFCLMSCSTQVEYTLIGTFEGEHKDQYNGKQVSAFLFNNGVTTELDSTMIESNSFIIKGDVFEKGIGYISYEGGGNPLIFIKEEGNIKVIIGNGEIKRSGTPLNASYQQFSDSIHSLIMGSIPLVQELEKLYESEKLTLEKFIEKEEEMDDYLEKMENFGLYRTKSRQSISRISIFGRHIFHKARKYKKYC